MQTLTLDVQDNFVEDFLTILEHYKDKVQLAKDKNLEYDSYFYEHQKKLHQIKTDVKSGEMRLLSEEESEAEIDLFFQELENNV